ncbi:MAG: M20/M25/M40 family metallo-hydrolase [Firmicutes bacterium]|nr:M20/M25/M40 family metallo-hydrolase [Bacillota bacterium]MBQ6948753.1 M20/M25/M40 family metallo-hydrolase [Bacillota bacterium]
MKPELSKRIEQIALELTGQLSVLDTPDEILIAEKVYSIMSEMKYFKAHPENLYFVPVKGDKLGRKSVVAIVNGEKKPSDKTVVMIGHIDTVGISDYGPLAEYANQPLVLTEKFKEIELPAQVKKDLESGEYLFGRGIFDMKSGDAIIMALMEMISDDIENFEGNLIYGAVCDEEGNSGGMLNVVPELCRLQDEKNYDYLALLDTDYMTEEYEGDENKYVYVGTVGKLMPTFFVVGKETHVGESFKGIDPNQIAAEITRRINLNPEFSDVAEGEVTLPPVTLKQRDLKPEYSVQIAKTAVVFFNYATHCSTPDQVLDKMVKAGQECFQNVVDMLNERYETFCEMAHRPFHKLPWEARTMTYHQLCEVVKAEVGEEFDAKVQAYAEELMKDETIDARDRNTHLVEYVHGMWSDKNPVLIVYFSQPYYPHIYIKGDEPKEKALLDAVADAVDTTNTDYKLVYKKFFPYISDLSYGAAPREDGIIEAFMENMPGYGTVYNLPMKEMQRLNLPVLDIGSFGKDAHKFTERIEKKYTFEVAPELVYKTVMNLLK